jgi:nicotinamidase-related amidase
MHSFPQKIKAQFQEVLPNTFVFRKFFGHSIKGTKGIDLYKGLKIVGTNRFTKQFGDAFSNPALKRYIRQKGITEVEIAGIDSTKYAYLTAKRAVKNGLKTAKLIDAIDTIYQQDVEKCEQDLKSRGVIYR